jgi:putative restriction endonuclease
MPSVFVYSAGQAAAQHFETSIRNGIPLSTFKPLLPASVYTTLEEAYQDGQCYLWGDRGGEHGRQYWNQMAAGDLALCYRERKFVAVSKVLATIENEPAGRAAWPDAISEPYRLLFFLSPPVWIDVPVATLPQYFGKVYQGLRRLPKSENILRDYGSLDRFVTEALLHTDATFIPKALPDALTAAQVLEAVREFDSGREHLFADSTGYDVVVEGKHYPPKAIVGLAAELVTGSQYGPDDFSGGLGSKCFRLLEQAGFQIVEKATSGAWIFQGNPQRFDIDGYLRRNSFIYWGVNRYVDDLRLGDACLIWRAGPHAGIVGIGKVAELPKPIREVNTPESLGRDLWHEDGDLGNETKVGIQLQEVRLSDEDGFVSRSVVAADPLLSQTALIRFRQGSVFRLTTFEANAALALWSAAREQTTAAESLTPLSEPAVSDLLPIFDDLGKPLHATCRIQSSGFTCEVIIESRGGTIGEPGAKNLDYSKGFERLVSRLSAIGAELTDALLIASSRNLEGMTEAERRLNADGHPFPIRLNPSLAEVITNALCRAQPNIGSTRKSGSGNRTRRVLLKIALQRLPPDGVPIKDYLTGAKSLGPITTPDLLEIAKEDFFEPTSIVDERRKAIAEIVRRQGSPQFRRLLLEAYGGRCAISGCDAEPALEAAHIIAYLGPRTNSVQNGVLLRADLHTLFDRGLLSIDPDKHRVVLHPSLRSTAYGILFGERIRLPDTKAWWPNSDALRIHLFACGLASTHEQA